VSAVSTPSLFWFRRDLRLADHPALQAAADAGPVVGVFVFDSALWSPSGTNRQAFLIDTLRSLDESMVAPLVVRQGDPAGELLAVAESVGATDVYATADFGPYGRRRDEAVAAALAELGVRVRYVDSPYTVQPGSVTTGSGTSYRVFTPFFRAWKAHGWPTAQGPVAVDWHDAGVASSWPERPTPTATVWPAAGERAAWERAEAFLADAVADYDERRDVPGVDGTSRLSPHLKLGVLHPRQLLDRLGTSKGEETFRSELAWRDFYAEVLFDRPDSARQAYRSEMAAMELDSGPQADTRFAAWAEGRTGYPIVDAGMRQLQAEGWMHNRVRMIVASFLIKDLHLDWTRGARHFLEHLLDGDLASNNHGWQWAAGTGTDAAPYFRIFNPMSQSKKFDPDGSYIRTWVPEVAHLPSSSIHAPWTEKAGAPAGYPAPIVDHDRERKEALRRYQELRDNSA
jgi:deoxyribodipyrimidine photo-lyase